MKKPVKYKYIVFHLSTWSDVTVYFHFLTLPMGIAMGEPTLLDTLHFSGQFVTDFAMYTFSFPLGTLIGVSYQFNC